MTDFEMYAILFGITAIVGLIIKIIYDICINNYTKLRNLFIKLNSYKDLEELNRKVNVVYSPAVLSYLMDQKIEPKKDITATLLKMYAEKVIDIKKTEDRYFFYRGKYNKILNSDEQYLYNCFIENNKLSIVQWAKLVKMEYLKYGFSKEKEDEKTKEKRYRKFSFILTIIMTIVSYILIHQWEMTTFAVCFSFSLLICFVGVELVYEFQRFYLNHNIFLSRKGKNEIKKWLKFEKFIDEYTLIEERNIEETVLFGKYIPYAMALNINKAYRNKMLDIIDINEFCKYMIHIDIEF